MGTIRLLHRVWVGPPMPDRLAAFGVAWRDLHPDWEHVLWGDADLDWLANRDLFDAAEDLVPHDAVGQFRADVARYELLTRYGGVYVDCDLEPLRPLEPLHVHDAWAAYESERRGRVGNTVLGATVADAPFWRLCVEALRDSVRRRAPGRPARVSGPGLVTRVRDARPELLHVYPRRYFYPYGWGQVGRVDPADVATDDAYAVHHWWHRRTVEGIPL